VGKTCIYCKRNLGFLNGKINLNDGNAICTACAEKAGINTFSGTAIVAAQNISSENLIRMIDGKKPLTSEDMMLVPYREKNMARIDNFTPTNRVGILVQFDDNAKEFIVGNGDTADLFQYENIVDYELLQNGATVSKGSMGGAVVGGLLFGAAGAVAGAAGSKRVEIDVCTNLSIKLTLKDTYRKVCYITFINSSLATNSNAYNVAYTLAQNCMSYFKIACDMVQEGQKPNNTMVQSSNADELRKFKELLDDGIITEEEFRVKKKQLLGL
jgi:hypothetical protein